MADIRIGDWFRNESDKDGAPLIRIESINGDDVMVSDWMSFEMPWTYQFRDGPPRGFGYGLDDAKAMLEKNWTRTPLCETQEEG